MKKVKNIGSQAGYSLVEITLALLVVAIGLVATFALFPVGLEASRDAVDDTEISLFAEYVFSTLDVTAAAFGANWDISDCKTFKSPALAGDEEDSRFKLVETGEDNTAVFEWVADYYGFPGSTIFDDAAFDDFATSTFTYQLNFFDWTDGSTYARLTVWPGTYESGVNPPDNKKRIFTRAIQAIRGEPMPTP